MLISELVERLKQYPQDMEIKIVDGHQGKVYSGDFELQCWKDPNTGIFNLDIGIGGLEEYEENDDY